MNRGGPLGFRIHVVNEELYCIGLSLGGDMVESCKDAEKAKEKHCCNHEEELKTDMGDWCSVASK